MTAKESGTYNDFTQINLGGLRTDGSDGSNEISYLALEVADEAAREAGAMVMDGWRAGGEISRKGRFDLLTWPIED